MPCGRGIFAALTHKDGKNPDFVRGDKKEFQKKRGAALIGKAAPLKEQKDQRQISRKQPRPSDSVKEYTPPSAG